MSIKVKEIKIMIKVKTELNQIITFEERDGTLVASIELQVAQIKQTYYQDMMDIIKVLKLDNISDTVREILEDKLEEHKDYLINDLTSYCDNHIPTYAELIKE